MENATKALLIAGGVLIAIIIISIGLYLYSMFSNQSKEYNDIISATELEKFNSKFNVYIGRNDIKAQEIVSIVNFAKEYNGQVEIYVEIDGKSERILFSGNPEEEVVLSQETFIKNNKDSYFSCKGNSKNPLYNEEGKIIKLTFKKEKK